VAVTTEEDSTDSTDEPDETETDTSDTEASDTDTDAPDDDTDTEAPGDDADIFGLAPTNTPRTRRPWKRYASIGLVTAIFVGAFGIAGVLGWKLWEQHTLDKAGQDARQSAVNYTQVLTSIDSNNLDENFDEVLNGATGDFKDMYTTESTKLRQLLIDNKATSHGVVVDSAIQSESKDKVVVLLLVDQTVTNTARPDSRVDRSRMKITMEKVDNRWLASKVELP